jgi:adenylate cyclase
LRRWLKGTLLGLVIGLIGGVVALTPLGTEFDQDFGLAWLFHTRGARDAPPEVAVVAIDSDTGEKLSLDRLPRTWPRSVHARLLDRLTELGAAVVLFDMDFNRAKTPQDDRVFADAIARANRVILFENLVGKRQPIFGGDGRRQGWVWKEQSFPPTAILAQAARGVGPFPLPKLEESVFEFWAFKPSARDVATLPSLALQLLGLPHYKALRALLEQAGAGGLDELAQAPDEISKPGDLRTLMFQLRDLFKRYPQLAERLNLNLEAPASSVWNPEARRLLRALVGLYAGDDNRYLNFYGPPGSITTIPYADIALGADETSAAPPDLEGKVVFVGYVDLYDPGQPDRFYTVFTRSDGVDLSGVEIAATGFANLLTTNWVQAPQDWLVAAIVLGFGLVVGALAYRFPAHLAVPGVILLSVSWAATAQYVFNTKALWLPLSVPILLQLPLALLLGLLAQYLFERREKQRFTEAVGYYLPEQVARELVKKSLDSITLNKVVYATCFATDMAGFTTLGERFAPKELAAFMNDYFEALAEPLKRNGVDVTEFRADAIMCAWTAASSDPAVRTSATHAALDARDAIRAFSERNDPEHPLSIRVGLEAGKVYVGHAGGGGHFVYSIVGDCANTAARIESLNKRLGTQVLATGPVVEGMDDIITRPLGRFVFVGKRIAKPIVEVIAYAHMASDEQHLLCRLFGDALSAFEAEQWAEAERLFGVVLKTFPGDGPTQLYLDLCQRYRLEGPREEEPTLFYLDSK